MPFPLDYSKEITWDKNTELNPHEFQERFVSKMHEILAKADTRTILIRGNKILFNGNLFRFGFPNYYYETMLKGITLGIVEIKSVDEKFIVSYYLNFKQALILSFAFILPFACLAPFADDSPFFFKYCYFIFLWIFVVSVNYFMFVQSFSIFIKRVLKSV